MTEKEQIARWLGFKNPYKGYDDRYWLAYKSQPVRIPDFRISNEWAGVVLEKLLAYGFSIENSPDKDGKYVYWKIGKVLTEAIGRATDWRSAVVDAALELIKRQT